MRHALTLALLAGALAPSAIAAEAPETPADLRCMVVMINLSTAPENQKKMEALLGGFYFMGKLDARDPKFDMEARVVKEVQTMTPEQNVAETERCEKIFRTRVDALATMSENIAKKLEEDDKKATDKEKSEAPATPPK